MKRCTLCGREGHLAGNCDWPKKGNVKLTASQVREIRKFGEERKELKDRIDALSNRSLAEIYGVGEQTIRDVILGYSWPDV